MKYGKYTTAGFDRESEMKSCKLAIVQTHWRAKTMGVSHAGQH